MSGLKLEVGKFYRDADGKKRGPMRISSHIWDYAESEGTFESNGKSYNGWDADLIAEWPEESTQ